MQKEKKNFKKRKVNYMKLILNHLGISKQFPSVKALDNVDLEINRSVIILIKKVDIKESQIDR